MFQSFQQWYQRYLSEPDAVVLLAVFGFIFILISSFGGILAPALAAIVISYLMDAPVHYLKDKGLSNRLAVSLVYFLFISVLLLFTIFILPLIWTQLTNLIQATPKIVDKVQSLLSNVPDRFKPLVSSITLEHVMGHFGSQLSSLSQLLLSVSLSSIANIITIIIYLVLVPMLVFFFLLDKHVISSWMMDFLPNKRQKVTYIWAEIREQLGRYVKGKAIELILVAVVTTVTFIALGIDYPILLGVATGVAVIIPIIGAVIVTIPILLIAFIQWGWTNEFFYLVAAYSVISLLDAYVLVPLLFAEAVNVHPIAILLAILFFGGIWGFWGIFFAIPLAIVVKALIEHWPKKEPQMA